MYRYAGRLTSQAIDSISLSRGFDSLPELNTEHATSKQPTECFTEGQRGAHLMPKVWLYKLYGSEHAAEDAQGKPPETPKPTAGEA